MNQNRSSISSSQYIIETAKRTRAIWLGNLNVHDGYLLPVDMDRLEGIFRITNTITYRNMILTNKDWMEFISSCYSLSCTECGNEGWKAINGKKQSIEEWLKEEIERDSSQHDPNKKALFKLDKSKFLDSTIITAYNICKMKRLIIDGLHRAAALTMACKDSIPIPSVTIVECSGRELNVIFPCDIHQLT
jgi:hypothetical protein